MKTQNFNKKPTVLFCKKTELPSLNDFALEAGIHFDEYNCNFNKSYCFNLKKNYFFSKGIIDDSLYRILMDKIPLMQLYIGPTNHAYFDLYMKRHIIYENLDKISKVYYRLSDSKSQRIFLKIITRLCVPYQYHYDYETHDEEQYFPVELSFSPQEVFLAAGVCDGKNILEFVKKTKYKHIYGIEADENNFQLSKQNLTGIENLELLQYALHSKNNEKISFWSSKLTGKKGNAHVQPNGDVCVTTICGDSLDYPPTFIKMDIEGSEKDALIGLRKYIKTKSPKLAICIYHFQEDFWEIPLLIHQLNPHYNIIIRNYEHMDSLLETVCYAYI